MAKELPEIPKELEILLPEVNKGVIVVGSKAYEMLPLYEGQLEKVISDLTEILERVNCPDGQCSKCGKIVRNALPKKVFNCPDDGEELLTMNEPPVKALIESGKIPGLVELVTGIPASVVKGDDNTPGMTLAQMKHFAGLFWKQNLSDDGMPEESLENFENLLEMLGVKKKNKMQTYLAPAEEKPQV